VLSPEKSDIRNSGTCCSSFPRSRFSDRHVRLVRQATALTSITSNPRCKDRRLVRQCMSDSCGWRLPSCEQRPSDRLVRLLSSDRTYPSRRMACSDPALNSRCCSLAARPRSTRQSMTLLPTEQTQLCGVEVAYRMATWHAASFK
jgi:hypothetical protein